MNALPPSLKQTTTTHSISQLSAILEADYAEVLCTRLSKSTLALESYRGSFLRMQYDPRTSYTNTDVLLFKPGEEVVWLGTDQFVPADYDYYEFCKERTSAQDRKKIDAVIKANNICIEAASIDISRLTLRRSKIGQAQKECPMHCPLSYIMMFLEDYNGQVDEVLERALRDACVAGRELVALLRANEFCKGELHSFTPTRNYIRALYLFGSYLLVVGKLDEAYDALQECLANDIHDKLGARHKQLTVVLEGRKGFRDKRLPGLLKAKFGDDHCVDDILSLWNYTRALESFITKGNCNKSKRLLNHAIDKNPYVPLLLLSWEFEENSDGTNLIKIGHFTEALDFVQDNRKHWKKCVGALAWLEEVYSNHTMAIIPNVTKKGRKLLSRGIELMETRDSNNLREAIGIFKELLAIAETDERYLLVQFKSLVKMGFCCKILEEPKRALIYFELARLMYGPQIDKDSYKELLYKSAACKEDLEDYCGAFDDYKTIMNEIGMFSTAFENLRRIEQKIGRKSGIIPGRVFPKPSKEDVKWMNNKMKETVLAAMSNCHNTKSEAEKLERCFHCKRGGIKLQTCDGCRNDEFIYCSKSCQKTSWHQIHKFTCVGSKAKLEDGCRVLLKGLEKAPQYNGETGNVVKYDPAKERFVVKLSGNGSQKLFKPQNLDIT